MSLRFGPRIPDESIVKLYKEKIRETHGRLYAALGEETEQALKLHLMIKFDVDFPDDHQLDQLLDSFLGVAHTQTQDEKMFVTLETNDLKNPEDCKTKKERAYFAMNYLKRNHLERITHKNYVKACSDLFGQSDYRTIKTNLGILVTDGELDKLKMRNIGKKNRHEQIYKFKENSIYNRFNSAKSLEKFTENFIEQFKNRGQVTLTEIKLFLEADYIITNKKFVQNRANHLKTAGIIEKYVETSENTVFNIFVE